MISGKVGPRKDPPDWPGGEWKDTSFLTLIHAVQVRRSKIYILEKQTAYQ
jgi:hypothetical protein